LAECSIGIPIDSPWIVGQLANEMASLKLAQLPNQMRGTRIFTMLQVEQISQWLLPGMSSRFFSLYNFLSYYIYGQISKGK
jgi:hypothetical protein